jgi:hypothetical protein
MEAKDNDPTCPAAPSFMCAVSFLFFFLLKEEKEEERKRRCV